MLSRYIFAGLLLFTTTNCFAQFGNRKFITYTTDNGLADNAVVKIAQDKKGFVWVATRNGLSRFDGARFTNYRVGDPAGNGLRSSWITDLVVDNRGLLWLSTEWGICFYDEPQDTFHYITSDVILYRAPLCLSGDTLWAATESGLRRINTLDKSVHTTSLMHIPDPQAICVRGGMVWTGTRGHGLYLYDISRNTFTAGAFPSLAADAHLMDFYPDGGKLWTASSDGLVLLDEAGNATRFTHRVGLPLHDTVNALMFVRSFPPVTGDSLLVCGTYTKTIAVFNKNKGLFTSVATGNSGAVFGIPATIFNTALSTPRILWLGTDRGLTMLNAGQQDFTSFFLQGAGAHGAKTIVKKALPSADPDKLFLLTNLPAGVVRFDRRNAVIEKRWGDNLGSRWYEGVVKNSREILLVHNGGIDRFSAAEGIVPLYQARGNTIYSGWAENSSNLWLGTDKGLLKLDVHTGATTAFPVNFKGTDVENNSFADAFLASDIAGDGKRLWISSTKYGLFSFDLTTHLFTPYRQPSRAAYETRNRCAALCFDRAGKLWLANFSGLTSFDTAAQTFTNYAAASGLHSTYIYDVTADNAGNIFGRGNSGVFYFDAKAKKFTNLALPAAMTGSVYLQRVSVIGDERIVGFEGGFSIFKSSPGERNSPPPVFITACEVNNKRRPLLPGGSLQLRYTDNNMQLQWAAPDFESPAELVYEYKLNDAVWTDAGTQHTVLFTGLQAGKYLFSIRTKNAADMRGAVTTLSFVIRPPFWRTIPFRVAMLLLTAGLLYFIYKMRLRSLERRRKSEIDHVRRQLELESVTSFFSTSLIGKKDTGEVLDHVTQDLIQQLGFENCMIYIWNEETQLLEQRTGYGRKGGIAGSSDRAKYNMEKDRGITGACYSSGKPILVNDTSKDPRYFSADETISGSELCVPLIYDSKMIGAINIEQQAKGFFNNRHVQLVSTIAALVTTKMAALEQTAKVHQKELELSEAANRITATELAMLRSRMNPHFIFNSLNSIQTYIWDSKQEDAAEYLTKFARLMRMVLEHSGSKTITLAEELAALKLYVELEHRRSNQKFDYSIVADERLDAAHTLTPPLLLQPYIENAIWHGLSDCGHRGELRVSITKKDNTLECVVEDNGIGREAASKKRKAAHRSMGLDISQQRIELMGEEVGISAYVKVTDKKDAAGKAAGTRITIILPLLTRHA